MKYKKTFYKTNRVNYTVTKGQDRIIDYIIKPLSVFILFFLGVFLSRRMTKRPVTIRTQLLCESADEISEKHGDKMLTAWYIRAYFWVSSRILEFDNAYYIRYHETLVRYNEKLEQNGLIKRK